MKTKFIIYSLLPILAFLLSSSFAFATVGGASIIYNFTYNPQDESVYYYRLNLGGAACGTILERLPLDMSKPMETVFSCEDSLELQEKCVNECVNVISRTLAEMTRNNKPLIQLDLFKNRIKVDVAYRGSSTKLGPADWGEPIITNNLVTVYQRNKIVREFNMSGCDKDQAFSFAGFGIPGYEKKIVLLTSAIRNCVEGGYVGEELQVIGGVNNLDKKNYKGFIYKNSYPLIPDRGTQVVYTRNSKRFSSVN